MAPFNVKNPSGFPEFPPAAEALRQQWVNIIQAAFKSFGFISIQTPLVEREENLLGKGGNAKEMYVLKRLLDEAGDSSHSGNALRFDQTVPLALYVARHQNDLTFPFKRSVIGPVFRGERAQKGRFRQFDQCDIDVIGNGELSLHNDAQIPGVIIEIFKGLELGPFMVRINNRKILTGLFQSLGIPESEMKATLDIVDDLEKLPREKILASFTEAGLNQAQVDKILEFVSADHEDMNQLSKICDHKLFQQGVTELSTVLESLEAMGVDKAFYTVDTSIARGLDYYTGTVYETTLTDHPEFGSVCSGGRYDDLASIFTGKSMPGVGISIGLTRLFSQALEAGLITPGQASPTQVLLIAADSAALPELLALGAELRAADLVAENYLENKKLAKQFDYADKLGIPYVVVMGQNELNAGVAQIKNMTTGDKEEVKVGEVVKHLKSKLI